MPIEIDLSAIPPLPVNWQEGMHDGYLHLFGGEHPIDAMLEVHHYFYVREREYRLERWVMEELKFLRSTGTYRFPKEYNFAWSIGLELYARQGERVLMKKKIK
jgi:hypothetical protein